MPPHAGGGLGWDALAADLDGISMGQTWMECPCGGLGWDALVADLDGMPLWWHGADLDGMHLWWHGVDLDGMP